ncbi:hypothetical protein [Cupriavidus sp. UME77]|uniref:hypothetical protein n=1 Tax=Cupriavidus sp. UME77 TaxID=1862321 RepID=UPI001603DC39|nr:hypothetical protein [Cupriavidus sp. UME77]MBB1630274.1 hypothetical protein [Cupriavidus sp. UME77]
MSTTAESPNAYGTTAELAFLKHLGGQLTRKVLLRNYIAAAERRTVWGSIDKYRVLGYAMQLLGEAENAEQLAARAA